MKFSARLAGRSLERRFERMQRALEVAAIGAAAEALAILVELEREREGLRAPLQRTSAGKRRFVGAGDSESLARELGSPGQAPAPWLAPSLPGARAPMRAAALLAVARALSGRSGR